MSNPVMLFRASLAEEEELSVAKGLFDVYEQRAHIPSDSLVIPRYSALPFYRELEEDVRYAGSCLINTFRQHRYVADLRNWYEDLKDVTPKTWFVPSQVPQDAKGSFVLKGETNSKKHNWNTHMFAPTRADISRVHSNLWKDGLISSQDVYVREYLELNQLLEPIMNGLPITEEYRFFCYKETILASGFYWSEHYDELQHQGKSVDPSTVPASFLKHVMSKVSEHIPFYVVDIGRAADGDWIVIELNDGQMSGLSMCDPYELYRNLRAVLGE